MLQFSCLFLSLWKVAYLSFISRDLKVHVQPAGSYRKFYNSVVWSLLSRCTVKPQGTYMYRYRSTYGFSLSRVKLPSMNPASKFHSAIMGFQENTYCKRGWEQS